MKFKFIAWSDPYYHEELMLRWEVVEKPKGLPPGFERREQEKMSFHLVALDKKKLVGCLVCQPHSDTEGEIFHFAMSEEYKGKPFARQMLLALEEFLFQKGINHIYVMAEKADVDVYFHLGFSAEGTLFEQNGIYYQKLGKGFSFPNSVSA
jgi:ribosomal protein S18 acetylase RimI-like enzyme